MVGTGRVSVLQVYFVYIKSYGRFHYAHQPKRSSMRRGRTRTAAGSVCGLDMNQSLSQPTKCILLPTNRAPELTKLQAALHVGVR